MVCCSRVFAPIASGTAWLGWYIPCDADVVARRLRNLFLASTRNRPLWNDRNSAAVFLKIVDLHCHCYDVRLTGSATCWHSETATGRWWPGADVRVIDVVHIIIITIVLLLTFACCSFDCLFISYPATCTCGYILSKRPVQVVGLEYRNRVDVCPITWRVMDTRLESWKRLKNEQNSVIWEWKSCRLVRSLLR